MLEMRLMKLQKMYNMNNQAIRNLCNNSHSSGEIYELSLLMEKICSLSKRLCKEISDSDQNKYLIKDALKLDQSWLKLLLYVDQAYDYRIAKAV